MSVGRYQARSPCRRWIIASRPPAGLAPARRSRDCTPKLGSPVVPFSLFLVQGFFTKYPTPKVCPYFLTWLLGFQGKGAIEASQSDAKKALEQFRASKSAQGISDATRVRLARTLSTSVSVFLVASCTPESDIQCRISRARVPKP